MNEHERKAMADLGELLKSAAPPITRREHLEGRARLIASVEKMRRPSRTRFYALIASGAVVAVAMVATAATRWHAGTPGSAPAMVERASPPAVVTPAKEAPAPEPEIIELGPLPGIDRPSSAPSVPSAPSGPSVSSAAKAPTWRELVARGEFKRVLREAKGAGFGNVLRTRPVADLRALGDAVRYSGDEDLQARAVYEAIRDRFPGTDDAHVSAFVLGRLSEEHANRPDDAIVWYATYLRESGTGPFAGDARGRTMVLVARRSRQEARPLAMEYLRLYPHGPYEKPALDLTR